MLSDIVGGGQFNAAKGCGKLVATSAAMKIVEPDSSGLAGSTSERNN